MMDVRNTKQVVDIIHFIILLWRRLINNLPALFVTYYYYKKLKAPFRFLSSVKTSKQQKTTISNSKILQKRNSKCNMVNVFDSVGWRRNSVLCKLYALQVVILLVLCNVATSNKNNSDNNIIPVFLNFDYGASNRSTPALQTIYALAIEHFNERRSDILPWLDRVKTCPVQLQPITCASFCSPQSALQNMLDVLSKVNFVGAISGVQCENEAGNNVK